MDELNPTCTKGANAESVPASSRGVELLNELVRRGLSDALDRYDAATDLAVLTKAIRTACLSEHPHLQSASRGELRWDDPIPDEYVEFVALLMVLGLAAIGRAMVVIQHDSNNYHLAGSPASVLLRPMFEGIVWLDHLLSGGDNERYFDFAVSYEMQRNYVVEAGAGFPSWSRLRVADTGQLKSRIDGPRVDKCSREGWWLRADANEAAWLMRRAVAFDPSVAKATSYPLQLDQARDIWVAIGKRLPRDSAMRVAWQRHNRSWNLMSRYPFGVEVKEAIRASRLRAIFSDVETPDGLPWTPEDYLVWSGLTTANPYTHFSPLRVGPSPENDEVTARFSLTKALQFLLMLPRVLPPSYAWSADIEQATTRADESLRLLAIGAASRG